MLLGTHLGRGGQIDAVGRGAAAAQEGAYRDLVGSLNISVEEMKRMLRDCLPR